jgi:hypothetical protein
MLSSLAFRGGPRRPQIDQLGDIQGGGGGRQRVNPVPLFDSFAILLLRIACLGTLDGLSLSTLQTKRSLKYKPVK